jgi:RNA-binding protein NOB1
MSGWLAAAKADAPVASAPRVPEAEAGKTKVVVDANAIVKGIRLERLAEEAVTIPEVLREIKDRQARHTLATLPFELKVRDPDEESIKAVRRFARLTGDLGALSDPDVRCIALHLTLEKEAHGLAHVRSEPPPLVLSKHKHNKQTKQPGWDYVPDTDAWAELDAMNAEAERSAEEVASRMASASLAEAPEKPAPLPATALLALEMKERLEKKRAKERETRALLGEDKGAEPAEAAEGDEKNDEKNDDDDDGGWEQNVSRTTRIRRAKRAERQREAAEKEVAEKAEKASEVDLREVPTATETVATDTARVADLNAAADASAAFFRGDEIAVATDEVDEDDEDDEDESASGSSEEEEEEDFESTVVSATGDYAMQNVILQMGLRLTTPDGMRVSELRRWVLRCHACGDVTKQTTRVFCAKCGNATLQKVQHTVGRTGRSSSACGGNTRFEAQSSRSPRRREDAGRRRPSCARTSSSACGAVKKRDDEDVFAAEYNEESFAGSSRGQKPGTAHLYHQETSWRAGASRRRTPTNAGSSARTDAESSDYVESRL